MSTSAHPRRGFTLIELLLVITVIAALMAGLVPAVTAVLKRSRVGATQRLVDATAAAIATYGAERWNWSIELAPPPNQRLQRYSRPLWDLNQDGLLDGRPGRASQTGDATRDTGETGAAPFINAVVDGGYAGIVAMAMPTLTKRQVDARGRVIDAWRQPLRIAYPDANRRYGNAWCGIWSVGPTGPSGPADDDLRSWRNHDER